MTNLKKPSFAWNNLYIPEVKEIFYLKYSFNTSQNVFKKAFVFNDL